MSQASVSVCVFVLLLPKYVGLDENSLSQQAAVFCQLLDELFQSAS